MTRTLLLFAAAVLLAGCAATRDYSAYAAPVATLTAADEINKGKTPAEKAAKARKLSEIAAGIELLSSPATTGADLAAVVAAKGQGKLEWAAMGVAVGLLFDEMAARSAFPVATLTASIAKGIRAAAAPYLLP